MASFDLIDTYMLFQFIKRLTSKFTSWEAFQKGVIDENGNILVDKNTRTSDQNKSFTKFDLLILNLRKTLAKIPGGNSQLATFAAALYLLKEDREVDDLSLIQEKLFSSLKDKNTFVLMEEITNSASPVAIAGLDNPPKFAGHRVFDVNTDTFMNSRFGKKPRDRYKKYLDEEDHDSIRDYCVRNPKESIVLRDKKSGSMIYLRKKN